MSKELVEAALEGDLKKVKDLIENQKADICHQILGGSDRDYLTPLLAAARGGHNHIIDYLLARNKTLSDQKSILDALAVASFYGKIETIDHLVKTFHLDPSLLSIISYSSIKWFLSGHQQVNILSMAVAGGQIATIKHLMENYNVKFLIDTNNEEYIISNGFVFSSIILAAQHGHINVVEFLIENGFNVKAKNSRGNTASAVAAENNKPKMLHYLNKIHSLPLSDVGDDGGWTPFLISISQGKADTTLYFIKKHPGCFLEKNTKGDSAVDLAIIAYYFGHENSLRILLNAGAYVNLTKINRPSFFNYLDKETYGTFDAAEALLELLDKNSNESDVMVNLNKLGNSINARRLPDGNSALHLAFLRDKKEFVEILLERGGRLNLLNTSNQTFLDLAKESKEQYYQERIAYYQALDDIRQAEETIEDIKQGLFDIDLKAISIRRNKDLEEFPDSKETEELKERQEKREVHPRKEFNDNLEKILSTIKTLSGREKNTLCFKLGKLLVSHKPLCFNPAIAYDLLMQVNSTSYHFKETNQILYKILLECQIDLKLDQETINALIDASILGEIDETASKNLADFLKKTKFSLLQYNELKKTRILEVKELNNQFIESAKKGDLKSLKELIQHRGINVQGKCPGEASALLWAAAKGHNNVVAYLLNNGSTMDETNDGGSTVLLVAARYGQFDTVKFLLENYANKIKFDFKNNGGENILHCAAFGGNIPLIQYLLETRNMKIDEINNCGDNLLIRAAMGNQVAAMDYFVGSCDSKISSKNNTGDNMLLKAALMGSNSAIKHVMKTYKLDIFEKNTSEGDNVLSLAAWQGKTEAVRLLLNLGACLDLPLLNGRTATQEIEQHKDKSALPLLKSAGQLLDLADKNAKEISEQEINAVLTILKAGINACRHNDLNTALHLAFYKDNIVLAKRLIEQGANLQAINKAGKTPFDLIKDDKLMPYLRVWDSINTLDALLSEIEGSQYVIQLQTDLKESKEAEEKQSLETKKLQDYRANSYTTDRKIEITVGLRIAIQVAKEVIQSLKGEEKSRACIKLGELFLKPGTPIFNAKMAYEFLMQVGQKPRDLAQKATGYIYNLFKNNQITTEKEREGSKELAQTYSTLRMFLFSGINNPEEAKRLVAAYVASLDAPLLNNITGFNADSLLALIDFLKESVEHIAQWEKAILDARLEITRLKEGKERQYWLDFQGVKKSVLGSIPLASLAQVRVESPEAEVKSYKDHVKIPFLKELMPGSKARAITQQMLSKDSYLRALGGIAKVEYLFKEIAHKNEKARQKGDLKEKQESKAALEILEQQHLQLTQALELINDAIEKLAGPEKNECLFKIGSMVATPNSPFFDPVAAYTYLNQMSHSINTIETLSLFSKAHDLISTLFSGGHMVLQEDGIAVRTEGQSLVMDKNAQNCHLRNIIKHLLLAGSEKQETLSKFIAEYALGSALSIKGLPGVTGVNVDSFMALVVSLRDKQENVRLLKEETIRLNFELDDLEKNRMAEQSHGASPQFLLQYAQQPAGNLTEPKGDKSNISAGLGLTS